MPIVSKLLLTWEPVYCRLHHRMGESASSAALRKVKASPRVRMAARLYASGAVPTKKAASAAAGLHPNYLTMLSRPGVENPEVERVIGEVDHAIQDKTVALSQVIALLSRRAAEKMRDLMESENEHIVFKASTDILDRNPDTSKMHKSAILHAPLEQGDAQALAKALVEAAQVRERYAGIVEGDFIRVDMEETSDGVQKREELRKALPAGDQESQDGSEDADRSGGTGTSAGDEGTEPPEAPVIELVATDKGRLIQERDAEASERHRKP